MIFGLLVLVDLEVCSGFRDLLEVVSVHQRRRKHDVGDDRTRLVLRGVLLETEIRREVLARHRFADQHPIKISVRFSDIQTLLGRRKHIQLDHKVFADVIDESQHYMPNFSALLNVFLEH